MKISRQGHIVANSQVTQQKKILKHKPDLLSTDPCQPVRRARGDLFIVESDGSPCGRIQRAGNGEKSGLARAGIPGDGDEFPRRNLQGDVRERRQLSARMLEILADFRYFQDRHQISLRMEVMGETADDRQAG